MLFHIFQSQAERRNFGGSDFIEIQYCKLPQSAPIQEIVSIDSIIHWQLDSLYVSGDDMDSFYQHYGNIIIGGTYNNGTCGPMDLFGINFYSAKQACTIIERIKKEQPPEHEILQNWLKTGKPYSGFYILGI